MVTEDLYQKVAKIETKIEEHNRKLIAQEEKNDTLTKLTLLIEQQQEINKDHARQMEKFDNTLDRVNENLTQLNLSQKQMQQDMNQIGERVSSIETKQEEQKIDPIKVVKGILAYVATGVGGIILAIIYLKLDIK